ncbi:MAG: DUF167 domain-containing protein [Candidatus Saliniplasma sp.]
MTEDPVSSCLHQSDKGIYLDITVSPNSSEDSINGFDHWRKRLKVCVKDIAEDGKANSSIIELMAEKLGVSPRDVDIVKGRRSNKKRLFIAVEKDKVVNVLRSILEGK